MIVDREPEPERPGCPQALRGVVRARSAERAPYSRQSLPGMMRRMNSSKSGTVKAVSPWLGLQTMPFAISWLRVGPWRPSL